MRTYATAQLIGDRSHQCDATATAAGRDGARAFVLLDGIGSTDEIRDWTRTAARRLARAAAYHADAETGLRTQYERYAADHNLRRVYPDNGVHGGGNRNVVTSCLGSPDTDDEVKNEYGHPAIETVTRQMKDARLLLASDGAYEPLEDSCRDLAGYLTGNPGETARGFVQAAIDHASSRADNATILVADLRP